MKSHSNIKPHHCPHCEYSAKHQSSIVTHIKSMHDDNKRNQTTKTRNSQQSFRNNNNRPNNNNNSNNRNTNLIFSENIFSLYPNPLHSSQLSQIEPTRTRTSTSTSAPELRSNNISNPNLLNLNSSNNNISIFPNLANLAEPSLGTSPNLLQIQQSLNNTNTGGNSNASRDHPTLVRRDSLTNLLQPQLLQQTTNNNLPLLQNNPNNPNENFHFNDFLFDANGNLNGLPVVPTENNNQNGDRDREDMSNFLGARLLVAPLGTILETTGLNEINVDQVQLNLNKTDKDKELTNKMNDNNTTNDPPPLPKSTS